MNTVQASVLDSNFASARRGFHLRSHCLTSRVLIAGHSIGGHYKRVVAATFGATNTAGAGAAGGRSRVSFAVRE